MPVESEDSQTASTSKPGSEAGKAGKAAALAEESEEELARKIAESKQLAWGGSVPGDTAAPAAFKQPEKPAETKTEAKSEAKKEAATGNAMGLAPAGGVKAATEMSLEELEAEVARRRQAAGEK